MHVTHINDINLHCAVAINTEAIQCTYTFKLCTYIGCGVLTCDYLNIPHLIRILY